MCPCGSAKGHVAYRRPKLAQAGDALRQRLGPAGDGAARGTGAPSPSPRHRPPAQGLRVGPQPRRRVENPRAAQNPQRRRSGQRHRPRPRIARRNNCSHAAPPTTTGCGRREGAPCAQKQCACHCGPRLERKPHAVRIRHLAAVQALADLFEPIPAHACAATSPMNCPTSAFDLGDGQCIARALCRAWSMESSGLL